MILQTSKALSGSSSITEYMYYYIPGTNGSAAILLVRPNNSVAGDIISTIWYNNGTLIGSSGSVTISDEQMIYRFDMSGFSALSKIKVTINIYRNNTNISSTDISRKYCCTKVTPSAPTIDSNGNIVHSYNASGFTSKAICVTSDATDSDGRFSIDDDYRNLLFGVTMSNYENHYIIGNTKQNTIYRFGRGTVLINIFVYMTDSSSSAVKINSSTSLTGNRATIVSRINDWIDTMNDLLSECGMSFSRTATTISGNIDVYIGTQSQLGLDTSESRVYGGTFEVDTYGGKRIVSMKVNLSSESRYPWDLSTVSWKTESNGMIDGINNFEGIVYEELTQACGLVHDIYDIKNLGKTNSFETPYDYQTIFCEISYPFKTLGGFKGTKYARDESIIKKYYSMFETVDTDIEKISMYPNGLFVDMNCTKGMFYSETSFVFKPKINYSISVIYANSDSDNFVSEYNASTTLEYTNESEPTSFYSSLPNTPSISNIVGIDNEYQGTESSGSSNGEKGGFKFDLSGLSTDGEKYHVLLFLKNCGLREGSHYGHEFIAEYNVSSGSYSGNESNTYNKLLYGRTYDIYLYSSYGICKSDYISVGSKTVPPRVPKLSDAVIVNNGNGVHTVTVKYSTYTYYQTEIKSVQDRLQWILYKDGAIFSTDTITYSENSSTYKGEFSFTVNGDGAYKLVAYTIRDINGTSIYCTDSSGGSNLPSITNKNIYYFNIYDSAAFYWIDSQETFTSEDKILTNKITVDKWNAYVSKIRSYCSVKGYLSSASYTLPDDTNKFGDASSQTFGSALNLIGRSASYNTFTAHMYNIVYYILNVLLNTTASDYVSANDNVTALEMMYLQNGINNITI